jgi:hypothetical protein
VATKRVLVIIKGENEEGKENKGRGRGGSHYMVTKKVLIAIKWNQKRRGKKFWQSKGFLLP